MIKLEEPLAKTEHSTFDRHVFFSLNITNPDERTLETIGQQMLEEIGDWISTSFKNNYILIEHASNRIAGGYMDNASGWKEDKRTMRDDYAWKSRYELRCSDQDASWFLLRWGS